MVSKNRGQIGKLEQQTQLNYTAAINYYAQKKAQFLKMGVIKERQDEKVFLNKYMENIKQIVENIIVKKWQKIYNQIVSAAQVGDYYTGQKYTIDENKITDIPNWLRENLIAGQNDQNFYSLMGFNYETYAEQAMRDIGKELFSKGYNDCMSAFYRTGAMKSISAMRPGFLDIRADLGQGFEQMGKIVGDKTSNLPVEFQQEFSIENRIINENTLINDDELIRKYLQSGMFGVSIKLWAQGSSNKEFTKAVGIQNRLNDMYNTKRTWNTTYASQMANKVVSNYLLDIVGPVNIAVLTGTGLVWMDEFIGSNLFTMTVYAKNNRLYMNKGVLNEIKPEVRDSSILIRRYNMAKAISMKKAMVSSTRLLTKDSKKYRVAMRLKRV